LNPNLEFYSKNNERRHMIDIDPTAIVAHATTKPEEPPDLEEGDILFYSQIWVKGTPLHFIPDRGIHKNLISLEVFKQFGLSTTSHLKPYKRRFLC
jgi:hypothetical protein